MLASAPFISTSSTISLSTGSGQVVVKAVLFTSVVNAGDAPSVFDLMSNQNVETVTSKSDIVLVTLAVLCAVAGVLAFSLLTEQSLAVRLGSLGAGLALGVVIAWFSPSGKRLLQYGRQSYEELRRVVWPTKKETLNTTGLVMAFVVLMAFFLFICDKIIEWGLYDVLLRLSF